MKLLKFASLLLVSLALLGPRKVWARANLTCPKSVKFNNQPIECFYENPRLFAASTVTVDFGDQSDAAVFQQSGNASLSLCEDSKTIWSFRNEHCRSSGLGLSLNGASILDWINGPLQIPTFPTPSLTFFPQMSTPPPVTFFPQMSTPSPWSPKAFASGTAFLLLNFEFTENVYVNGVQFYSKDPGYIYLYV